MNDNIGPYFKTFKGLRQGDSLSPLNFDLAADALAIMLDNARKIGLVKGVLDECVTDGINMLQYADDTIFILQDDINSAHNLKCILCLFEQMSGLKINFQKSEVLMVLRDDERDKCMLIS